jgi:formylglycine-generating enzyme required for sulfatase activity
VTLRSFLLVLALLLPTVCTAAEPVVVRDCELCPELVVLPAGRFMMGAEPEEGQRLGMPEHYWAREGPRHEVRVQPFAIARTELTRAAFAAYVEASGHEPAPGCWHFVGDDWKFDPARSWRNPGFPQRDDHPVMCVNWHDARAYADWLSQQSGHPYRLPSEAEWEYAARAGTATTYWFGDGPEEICRFVNLGDLTTRDVVDWHTKQNKFPQGIQWRGHECRDGYSWTAPVTAFPPNPWGVYGLLGNANEWLADCWHQTHDGAPATAAARSDGDCNLRVLRGEAWTAIPGSTRPAFRLRLDANDRRFTLGIRVARDVAP